MQYLDFGELEEQERTTTTVTRNPDRPAESEAGDNATKDRGDVGRGLEQERGRGRRRLPP